MKTYKSIRKKIFQILGNGNVIHHDPTEDNKIGQSSVHTFIDDIIIITLNSSDESDAFKKLFRYLECTIDEK